MDYDLKRQELLEQEMIDSGVLRYQNAITRAKRGLKTQALESNTSYSVSIMRTYVQDVSDQISNDVASKLGRAGGGRKPLAWKYLSKLNPDVCAFITCKTILDNISGVTPLSTLVYRIASKVEDQTRLDMFKIQDKKYYSATVKYMKEKQHAETYHKKKRVLVHGAKKREDIIKPWVEWPMNDKIHIGNALLEAFIKVTSDYNEDGHRIVGTGLIEKSVQNSGKKTTYVVHGTSKTAAWITANQEVCQYFTPDFMPCVAPPLDWTSATTGGYHTEALQKRKPLVKMQARDNVHSLDVYNIADMPAFFDAVNTLQATPWEINTFVYNQLLKEFQAPHGVGMPGNEPLMRPAEPAFFIPQGNMSGDEWKKVRKQAASLWSDKQKQEYMDWTLAVQKWNREENSRISEVLAVSRTINTARRFAFEDKFYFVWTADFRGRLYAASTAITPQGTDKAKGVIRFHNGFPLGKTGLYHLCIHAAGVYGNDKGELDDRVAWVMQNKDAFIQTYNDPDSTREWWKGADKPYCFLAVCEELGQVLQMTDSQAENFMSYIPCAQDGSCNGIQHYSAMLRDMTGAMAVNLIDSVIPADIYMQTAAKVVEYINRSIEDKVTFNGVEWVKSEPFETEIAKGWLDFGIARDCTKKPTMVIPYGGTKIGCRDQCRDYLESFTKKKCEENPDYINPFIGLETFSTRVMKTDDGLLEITSKSDPEVQAITLLHHLVWHALDEVVVAARNAMKFLRSTMSAIQKSYEDGATVRITSPNGFPVFMNIKKTELYRVESHLEGTIQLAFQRDIPEIDKRRMGTSIAPNFLHMLDSAHLQRLVNLGKLMGIDDFACIHDSAGAHAGKCDILHTAIRYTFVEMHKVNLLKKFLDEQSSMHPQAIPEMPDIEDVAPGDFDLGQVIHSRHFFR